MRQSGIIAAGALYALENHVERLAEDHRNARRLAEALAGMPGIILDPAHVETNIIIFSVDPAIGTAESLAARMGEEGVDFFPVTPDSCRLVTHLDVSAEDIDQAIERFGQVLNRV